METLDLEIDNLRAALRWALAGEQVPDALRAKALAAYASHLFIEENPERAEAALRESLDLYRALGDTAGCASSLQVLASLRLWFHRVDEAYTLACEAGNLRMYAQVMASLAYTALFHDDPATARRLSEQALEVVPPTDAFGTALAEGNAGLAALSSRPSARAWASRNGRPRPGASSASRPSPARLAARLTVSLTATS
jgi:hypothetical protein